MQGLGNAIFLVSGLAMYVFEVMWFARWWDSFGLLVGIIAPPIAAAFPFIYLAKEGFSLLYFSVWAAGIGGALLASADD